MMYDARTLMANIKRRYPLIMTSREFEEATDRLIEITMSCDKTEQVAQMHHFMGEAIKMDQAGCKAVDRNSRDELRMSAAALFAAAYNLI